MANPLTQLMALFQGGGWAPGVQRTGVRPDFGLSGAQIGPLAKSPYERTLRPGEQRSSEDLRDMLAEVILAAGGAVVPGVGAKAQARRAPGARIRKAIPVETIELRPAGWKALSDSAVGRLESIKRPGHVYRGMEESEFNATVGAGRQVKSTGKYSHISEGTNFATHPADAESYVNFGRSDPRVTGRSTYLVEAKQSPDMTTGRDGYIKSPGPVEAARVWKMRNDNGRIIMELVMGE